MHDTESLKKIETSFVGKDIISLDQFDKASINKLIATVQTIKNTVKKGQAYDLLRGSVITLLFFEPSSRTFGSFSAAIKRIGGQTIDYQNPLQTSSAVKGETLEDTIQVFENYSDAIVIRHPEVGTAQRAANAANFIPVVNAGDGAGEHPTQALLDFVTMHEKLGKLDGLKGVMAGDLLYGRTIHSLIKGFSNYSNVTLYLLSPEKLKLPREMFEEYKHKGINLVEISSEKEIPNDCNFWYWTRVQKERFSDVNEYEKLKHSFVLTKKLLEEKGNKDLILMHPLPRVGEIETEVDSDPRALYLRDQVKNGMFTRMALMGLILGKL